MTNDFYNRALLYAKAAMALLKRGRIPPTPQYFELLYTYATGVNAQLNARINSLLEHGKTPDTDFVSGLHKEFMESNYMGDKIDHVSAEIATRIESVHGALDKAIINANHYSGLLENATGDLRTSMEQDDLAKLTGELLTETNNMKKTNQQLEGSLSTAREDIAALQEELEKVRRESMIDPLTRIPNRKAFDFYLSEALVRSETDGEDLSLMFIDIDHFKSFNDNFGHQTGDQVLRLVALTLDTNTKGSDVAARYGGEEFAVIMPGTPLENACEAANRLRKAVQSRELVKRSTNEKLGHVTASFGVATFRFGDTTTTLIERADKCLYAAKANGRNCVINEDELDQLTKSGKLKKNSTSAA